MSLKFTKNQTLVLEIFFNHPQKSFYLRQLARMLDKEPGVFQKDVNRLVEDGLLLSSYQAHSRFFKLNKKHPLYSELKSIFFKTVGIEGTLKKALGKIKGIKRAFIYGSFAQGEEQKESDVDLMIIGSVSENDILDLVSELEDQFKRAINYTLISEKEFQEKIESKNSFLENILRREKIELI